MQKKMRLVNNPCSKYCAERTMTCHATCEKYKVAKAEHERLMQIERQRREADGYEAIASRRRHK